MWITWWKNSIIISNWVRVAFFWEKGGRRERGSMFVIWFQMFCFFLVLKWKSLSYQILINHFVFKFKLKKKLIKIGNKIPLLNNYNNVPLNLDFYWVCEGKKTCIINTRKVRLNELIKFLIFLFSLRNVRNRMKQCKTNICAFGKCLNAFDFVLIHYTYYFLIVAFFCLLYVYIKPF